jgi:uncharacterized protein YjbJ (UPF0337 family)
MSDDKLEGTFREAKGRVQGAAGDLLGDSKNQAEGKLNEVAGKLQQNYGEAADQLRGLAGELTDRIHETPLLATLAALGLGYVIGRLTAR